MVAQGGTSISWLSRIAIVVSTSGFPGWNAAGGVGGGLGTLLGPEGAGDVYVVCTFGTDPLAGVVVQDWSCGHTALVSGCGCRGWGRSCS